MRNRLNDLRDRRSAIAVIGLGYVGLPLAVAFARHFYVIGFDISDVKIAQLRSGLDVTKEVKPETLQSVQINFTTDPAMLRRASVVIVTVPTPIESAYQPDLGPLKSASRTIGRQLQPGTTVVYESTVYPGLTEDVCVPILAAESGLRFGVDFTVGYSPERMNPGDPARTVETITKVVAGSDPETLGFLSELYGTIVRAGIHQATSIKVAEAAKVIENTQRDINIALMNELAIIFHKLGINTADVLAAAATKWNFINMKPGLVGGHCIGVDPYYLTHKAQEVGYHPEMILAGRRINDGMGVYLARQLIKQMMRNQSPVTGATVVVFGLTFKENVSDVRNTRVIDVIQELLEYGLSVQVVDPVADAEAARHEYGIALTNVAELGTMDAVVYAVAHDVFKTEPYAQVLAACPVGVSVRAIPEGATGKWWVL